MKYNTKLKTGLNAKIFLFAVTAACLSLWFAKAANAVQILTPSNYAVASIGVNQQYYLDRTYVITSIPSGLSVGSEKWIKTRNNDKNNTSSTFLSFSISQDSIVYVGYDSRATGLPVWLSNNFNSTGMTIGVSEEMGHFNVYQKTFAAGTITLGGNMVPVARGVTSNYIVIVQPLASVPQLVFTQNMMRFSVEEGGVVVPQSISIDTNDTKNVSVSVLDDASWLSVIPSAGVTPLSIGIVVDVSGLIPGVYTATITGTAPGYGNDTVIVTLTVHPVLAYELQMSKSSDRSDAVPLNGQTVSGDVYVFTAPDTDVEQVGFYLDDPLMSGAPLFVDADSPFDFSGANQGTFYEDNGIISIEAEHYSGKVSQGGHDWTFVSPAGFSGSGAMQSTPNSNTNRNSDYVLNSPRMDYRVAFSQTGTYYVWIRGMGATDSDDSVHVGLNGNAVSSSDRIAGFLPSWTWSQSTMDGPVAAINIPSVGSHTVNVWMREDGFTIDKVVLVRTASCPECSGTAPAETAAASPFDTRQLLDGSHRIQAAIELDSGGTVVAVSNFTVANNAAALPIVDDFSDGNANGWAVVSDSGRSADWRVIGNRYQQTAIFGGSTFDGSYHTGLYAYLPAGIGLANYRFRADLTPLGVQCNDIGVMFRYLDDDNYYRLSLSARYGFTRLEKKVGGVFHPIAHNARGYIKGQTIHVEIVLIGGFIHVSVDGDSLFGVYDTSLSTGTVALYAQEEAAFDNISIDMPASDPEVVLTTPLSHSVTASDDLILSAIAYNMPVNKEVRFFLDGSACEPATEGPSGVFSSECFDVPRGNYSLEAVLYDNGSPAASDINVMVAARGDYIVAVGDSITNGTDDNFSSDNRSLNEKIISIQGYEANLTDLMTSHLNIPVIVYNEGIPGDDTYNANAYRIDSILERQAGVNKVLVLLGTNDSRRMLPIQSGLGCTGSACNGTYKGNMQALINKVIAGGAVPIVGLVPPSFEVADPLNSSRNELIQEYNAVIRTELTGIQVGPDFFSFFLNTDDNFSNLFVDEVHPNGLGFVVMAHMWYNSFPVADIAMPYILYDLLPLHYKQNILEAGNSYYTDDTGYTVTAIPLILEDGIWISTANSDRNNTDDNYISFTTDRDIRLYIAYDGGAATRPGWMSDYTDTGVNLSTTNPSAPLHRLYRKDFTAGSIVLGGNMAAGAIGADANYVAIVKEN